MATVDHSNSLPGRGYDLEFVEQPPSEFECPICMLVLRDPHLTSCCGHLFCATCIRRIKQQSKRCPLCNEEFSTFLDKGRQRRVNELLVKCTERADGCEWIGELGQLKKHQNLEELEGECQYVKVVCPNRCSRKVARNLLPNHLQNQCEMRRYKCDQCGLEATYMKIIQDHGALCGLREQSCPNGCPIVNLRQGLLSEHLLVWCPEQEVECKFASLGCTQRPKRKLLDKHMRECSCQHLDQLEQAHTNAVKRISQLEQTNATLTAERQLMTQKIDSLQVQLQQVQGIIEKQLHIHIPQAPETATIQPQVPAADAPQGTQNAEWLMHITMEANKHATTHDGAGKGAAANANSQFVMPLIIRFDQFWDHCSSNDGKWFSVPFYTQHEGYKMCLRVMGNGNGDGRGSGLNTHISAHFYLMQGEYDNALVWPYTGKLIIEMLNQLEDSHHYRREVVIDNSATMKVRVQVKDRQRAAQGRGKSELIAHKDLNYNPAKNQQYLVNGVIFFKLSVAVV